LPEANGRWFIFEENSPENFSPLMHEIATILPYVQGSFRLDGAFKMNCTEIPAPSPVKERGLRRFRRFAKDERGSTAIEFVLLIFPFVLMMFAIIETGLSFATQQVMSNAADDLARSIRVNDVTQADITAAGVRDAICGQISFMVAAGCPGLYIDLKEYAHYSDVPLAIPRKGDGDLNTAGFGITPGGSTTKNQIRVFYRWPIYTNFMRRYLSNLPNGYTLLYATLTWQNEPFIAALGNPA
jgi:Flp pilus assembly protein TadG